MSTLLRTTIHDESHPVRREPRSLQRSVEFGRGRALHRAVAADPREAVDHAPATPVHERARLRQGHVGRAVPGDFDALEQRDRSAGDRQSILVERRREQRPVVLDEHDVPRGRVSRIDPLKQHRDGSRGEVHDANGIGASIA